MSASKKIQSKKGTTNVNEAARRELSITRDDYALCQYLHYRQGYPNDKNPGWCVDDKVEISDFVGVSRPGLYKMIDRLEAMKLIETDAVTGHCRATKLFIDTEAECKQSLRDGKSKRVNKVNTECKQSLHQSVNKVTRKELRYSKNISKNELEENLQNQPTTPPLKEAEHPTQKYSIPPPPAAPKFPAAWSELLSKAAKKPATKMKYSSERVYEVETPEEIATALMVCGSDQLFLDNFKRIAGLRPEDQVFDIFTAFLERRLIDGGTGYQTVKRFREHLLSFPGKYLYVKNAQQQEQKPQPKINNAVPVYR